MGCGPSQPAEGHRRVPAPRTGGEERLEVKPTGQAESPGHAWGSMEAPAAGSAGARRGSQGARSRFQPVSSGALGGALCCGTGPE